MKMFGHISCIAASGRMWRQQVKVVFGMVLAAGLAACASPATVEGMSNLPSASQQAAMPSEIKSNIEMAVVTGGEPTNPLWTSEVGNEEFREALERSLRSAGALAPAGTAAGYRLEASLVGIEQPIMGFNTTVTSTVDYRVSPIDGQGRTLQTVVVAPYTAKMSDSAFGVQRLRLANEGSIRENIREFIDQRVAFYSS
jgi:hypothetical protein